MGMHRMGPPENVVLALGKELGIRHFVESGTHLGGTANWAANHFERVTTMELSPHFHAEASKRLAARSQVRLLCGDSGKLLREIVGEMKGPAIFWLDAHWSGGETAGEDAECPVLLEIEEVNKSPLENVILVDDARLFCAPPPRPHKADQWPELATLLTALDAGTRRYVVLFEDVLVAVPVSARGFFSAWLQDAATQAQAAPSKPAPLWRRVFG